VGAEDGVPAGIRRVLGMPGWCSQEKGTEVVVVVVPRTRGDGEDAAEDTVERDDEDEDEEEEEKVRWRRWRADAGEDEAVAVGVGGGGGTGDSE
jgi:hypothetical protein